MIHVQPFDRLGRFRNEWLNARHHFSFADYHDPARMGVGGLRVWNDDEIAPGTGFDPHPHQEMEIITYVREGAITHRDSLGNEGRTEAGDVQVMHAGTGIVHAEYNLRDRRRPACSRSGSCPDRTASRPAGARAQFPAGRGRGWPRWPTAGRRRTARRCRCTPTPRCSPARCAAARPCGRRCGPGRAAYLVPATGARDGERHAGRHPRRCRDHRRDRARDHRDGGCGRGAGGRGRLNRVTPPCRRPPAARRAPRLDQRHRPRPVPGGLQAGVQQRRRRPAPARGSPCSRAARPANRVRRSAPASPARGPAHRRRRNARPPGPRRPEAAARSGRGTRRTAWRGRGA